MVEWGYYGADPVFLYRHGYLFLPWAIDMLTSGKQIAVVEGGTGCAKTSTLGISSIIQCALWPGVDILNVAPTTSQATDMLQEVAKWVEGSEFERFIQRTAAGDLYKYKPHPMMSINVFGKTSTFVCMTVGTEGNFVLGKDKDAIRVDEASLIMNIGAAIPRLVSRVRGIRSSGKPRGVLPHIAFITNPHDGNWSFDELKRKATEQTDDPKSKYFFVRPRSSDNVYITKKQMEFQMEMMDAQEQRRWLDVRDDVFATMGSIPIVLIQNCHRTYLDELLNRMRAEQSEFYHDREGMGCIHYELEADETRDYIVWGDPGTANAMSLALNNVPTVGAFDITDFPKKPAVLVAMRMIDGGGKYSPWINEMKRLIVKYKALGVYDATGMGKAFGEWPDMADYPLYPVTLAGLNKQTSKTMFMLFCGKGLFAWPKLQVLWHQANAYRESGPGVHKIPDDVLAGLFVASFYLRYQFWDVLKDILGQERKARNAKPEAQLPPQSNRYSRRSGRERKRGKATPRRLVRDSDFDS